MASRGQAAALEPLDLFFLFLLLETLSTQAIGAGVTDRLGRRLSTDQADLLLSCRQGASFPKPRMGKPSSREPTKTPRLSYPSSSYAELGEDVCHKQTTRFCA